MSKIVKARSVAIYEAVQVNSDEEEAIVREWVKEIAGPGQDVEPFIKNTREEHGYILRHVTGELLAVPAPDYLTQFEEIDSDEEPSLPEEITEDEIEKFSEELDGDTN